MLQRYLIARLLLCLTCAEMMSEGKTYSKKLIKMVQLGKNDQLFVQRRGTNEMVGQYFCDKGKCNISDCQDCFKIQSGYLVLILHNISHLDRFDANLNGGTPFLQNFSLDEDVSSTSTTTAFYDANLNEDVSSTATTTAVPDKTHIQGIKPNEPLHTTANPEAHTGETLPNEAKVVIGIIGVIVAIAAIVLRRMFHNRKPKKQEEEPTEMDAFVPKPNEV